MTSPANGTLDCITRSIAPELRELNERIFVALSSSNDMMNGIVRDYLQRKGKQIRPIVVILSAKLFGSDMADGRDRVINAAAAVEMLHNASLIHDDVVDESQMRRNTPTLNGIWDNHIAVLVGDFFTSTSLQLASATDDIRIVRVLASLGRRLAMGELDQISNVRHHRISEQAYMATIERKTASLFMACAEMGAYAAGIDAGDERVAALVDFARRLGLCFQITDDIFDYYPDSKEIGKPTGNDLREGKITLPLLSVLLDDSLPDHDRMLALATSDTMTPDVVETLTAYAIDNGGISYARSVMGRLAGEARDGLCAVFQPSETRTALLDLLDHILTRTC